MWFRLCGTRPVSHRLSGKQPLTKPAGFLRPGAQALRLPLLWDRALLDSGCLGAQAKLVNVWGLLAVGACSQDRHCHQQGPPGQC